MGEAFIVRRGGGGKLAYRIFGGTTYPTNPKEGDIWINTSVSIIGVEFADSLWTEAEFGKIAILGTLGGEDPTAENKTIEIFNFNIQGKNQKIKVKPDKIWQVQEDGNWKSLYGYIYHSGNWVLISIPELYLYDGSLGDATANLCESVTGGWAKTQGTLTQNSSYLRLHGSAGGFMYTINPINTTGFTKLNFTGNTAANPPGTPSNYRLSLCTGKPSGASASGEVVKMNIPYPSKNTISIDISNYQGDYYVTVKNGADSSANGATMYACWLS